MEHPQLDTLILTEEEYQIAQAHIRDAAYFQWIGAGCPLDRCIDFWLAAEREWIEYCYVPDRYASPEELHKAE